MFLRLVKGEKMIDLLAFLFIALFALSCYGMIKGLEKL